MARRKNYPDSWETLPSRFWAKVEKTDSCWNWTAYRAAEGYGQIIAGHNRMGAHRVAWLLTHGSLPPNGLHLDHLCRNRGCVNPAHLEPVGSYRPTLATDCVDLGRVDAAFGYLRAWLAREVEYRFTAARWHHAARLIGLELRHIHGEA